MVDLVVLSESLALTRKQQGLSQRKLAERAKVSVRTIQRIEAGGGGKVSFSDLQRIFSEIGWYFTVDYGKEMLIGVLSDEDELEKLYAKECPGYV